MRRPPSGDAIHPDRSAERLDPVGRASQARTVSDIRAPDTVILDEDRDSLVVTETARARCGGRFATFVSAWSRQ